MDDNIFVLYRFDTLFLFTEIKIFAAGDVELGIPNSSRTELFNYMRSKETCTPG
jgi:hypothetical protein